jgi:prevent-host-death family protein
MQTEWPLQDARNNLSRLIKQAVAGAAQVVTVHGRPTAVVVSAEEYARLIHRRTGKLSAVLLNPDTAGEDLDFSRDRYTDRKV